jgi:hypothetical protein
MVSKDNHIRNLYNFHILQKFPPRNKDVYDTCIHFTYDANGIFIGGIINTLEYRCPMCGILPSLKVILESLDLALNYINDFMTSYSIKETNVLEKICSSA